MRMRNWGTHEFSRASNKSCKINVGLIRGLSVVSTAGNGSSAFDWPASDGWFWFRGDKKLATVQSDTFDSERITRRIETRTVPRSRSMSSTDAVNTNWQNRNHSSSRTLPTCPPQLFANLERARRLAFDVFRRRLTDARFRLSPVAKRRSPTAS